VRRVVVDFFSQLSWIDFFIIVILAGGAFAGFQQGLIRWVLSWVSLIVAFVLAAQLKHPVTEALSTFWTAFSPDVREFWVFVVLFIGLSVGGWFIVRAFYRTTRLPIIKQLDEIGGAILGIVFAATSIVLLLVVFDSLFKGAATLPGGVGLPTDQVAGLKSFYKVMNDSVLVKFFNTTVIPVAGTLARPFVPSEIADFLHL
jgi:uncharacterized membrane protein required for colicin V production